MGKESVICIVILIGICTGNYITQKYTSKSIESMTKDLEGLRVELIKDEVSKEECEKKIKKADEQWEDMHNKMAYYIEHDELEKAETNLTSLKSFCETEEYTDAVSELDKTVFVLKHIEDKNEFSWQNIF